MRRCAHELKMRPWDVARCTITQLIAMLGDPEAESTRIPIRTMGDWRRLVEEIED